MRAHSSLALPLGSPWVRAGLEARREHQACARPERPCVEPAHRDVACQRVLSVSTEADWVPEAMVSPGDSMALWVFFLATILSDHTSRRILPADNRWSVDDRQISLASPIDAGG